MFKILWTHLNFMYYIHLIFPKRPHSDLYAINIVAAALWWEKIAQWASQDPGHI